VAQTALAVAASSWAVLMGLAPVLQIRRMLRERSSQAVSVGYFVILLIGFVLWIGYGAAAGLPALVIPNVIALIVGTTAVLVALRLRRPPSGLPDSPDAGCEASEASEASEAGGAALRGDRPGLGAVMRQDR